MASSGQYSTVTVQPINGQTLSDVTQQVTNALGSLQASVNALANANTINQLVTDWTDVPYNAGFFSGDNAINGVVPTNTLFAFSYKIIGSIMLVNTHFTVTTQTIGGVTCKEIRMQIATPTKTKFRTIISGTISTQPHIAPVFFINQTTTASGLGAAYINTSGGYVAVQRMDGTPKAAFVNSDVYETGFMLAIPIIAAANTTNLG